MPKVKAAQVMQESQVKVAQLEKCAGNPLPVINDIFYVFYSLQTQL